jgi:hypothetical protein
MELGGSWFEASLRKVLKTLAQKTSQVWWCITVIPAMQEEDIGELQSQADWDQKRRPYLKTNKHNGLRYAWFK